jgi:hypothetical protein
LFIFKRTVQHAERQTRNCNRRDGEMDTPLMAPYVSTTNEPAQPDKN